MAAISEHAKIVQIGEKFNLGELNLYRFQITNTHSAAVNIFSATSAEIPVSMFGLVKIAHASIQAPIATAQARCDINKGGAELSVLASGNMSFAATEATIGYIDIIGK